MNKEQLIEVNSVLNELGEYLDISKTEYEAAVASYEAVGNWLSRDTSELKQYNPKIYPQGSFMLGTMIKPINEEDDLDIDLVCKLERKPGEWVQKDLKEAVGDQIKANGKYKSMLEKQEGGRRCWTLIYSDDAGYHMDILPSFADDNLAVMLSEVFDASEVGDIDRLAIRITDNESDNYYTDQNVDNWLKSNPFGYAKWFFQRALVSSTRKMSLNESIDPVRAYENAKLPLQRVVQLLKRHRDIMFSSDQYDSEHKPISIIITTLASQAYDGSDNVTDAFRNVVGKMRGLIESRIDPIKGETVKWVPNPVNEEENFADKWVEEKEKEEYFEKWLDKLERDTNTMLEGIGKGQHVLFESLSSMYGENLSKKVFSSRAEKKRLLREAGKLKMAVGSGMLGAEGVKVKNHNFYGND